MHEPALPPKETACPAEGCKRADHFDRCSRVECPKRRARPTSPHEQLAGYEYNSLGDGAYKARPTTRD